MVRKKSVFTVTDDLSDVFNNLTIKSDVTVLKALEIILKQMKTTGNRERTLYDYDKQINHFVRITGVVNISDITVFHIYDWIESMEVSNVTKLTRLKCLKAFLNRCFKLGWLSIQFWNDIKIKVDSPIKEGATEQNVQTLLRHLDFNDFFQLRDATAILTMYQTGIRIGTLSKITEGHIDLEENVLRIPGSIVKNHEELILPFDDVLARLFTVLFKQNAIVRKNANRSNQLVFITRSGGSSQNTAMKNNIISKRIAQYAKKFNIENVNPHALRRGFAINLRKKGANISLISNALGHSDLSVTTRYLHYDKLEIAEELRNFLK